MHTLDAMLATLVGKSNSVIKQKAMKGVNTKEIKKKKNKIWLYGLNKKSVQSTF